MQDFNMSGNSDTYELIPDSGKVARLKTYLKSLDTLQRVKFAIGIALAITFITLCGVVAHKNAKLKDMSESLRFYEKEMGSCKSIEENLLEAQSKIYNLTEELDYIRSHRDNFTLNGNIYFGTSCFDLKYRKKLNISNGYHFIDLDGKDKGLDSFQVYCDFDKNITRVPPITAHIDFGQVSH